MNFKWNNVEINTYDDKYYPEYDTGYLTDGFVKYYKGYLVHREDGPALIMDNAKQWFFMGERHRLDGPAIEFNDGGVAYFIFGIRYKKSEFDNITKYYKIDKVLDEI